MIRHGTISTLLVALLCACSGPAEETFTREQMEEVFTANILGAFEQELAQLPDWTPESLEEALREVRGLVQSAPESREAVDSMMRIQELLVSGRLSHAETERGVDQLTEGFLATHGAELYAIADRHRQQVRPAPETAGKQPNTRIQLGRSPYTAEEMRQTTLWAPPAPSRRSDRPQDAIDPKSELLQLQETMETAATQTDLNAASRSLAAYWDRQLMEAEETIEAKLTDGEAAEQFWVARKAWRAWREAEVSLHGDAVRGGTARPMIENLTWADLTEKRVMGLRRIYGDDGSAGVD